MFKIFSHQIKFIHGFVIYFDIKCLEMSVYTHLSCFALLLKQIPRHFYDVWIFQYESEKGPHNLGIHSYLFNL